MKLALRKKIFAMKKIYFQSIISLHALTLALNKSMRASDDEQGINKLWPNVPISHKKKKLAYIFTFTLLCGASKRFMKAFKEKSENKNFNTTF